MNDVNSEAASAALSTAELGLLVLLQMITEDRMAAGDDPDGSATSGRAVAIIGVWRRLAAKVRLPGTPFDPGAEAGLAALRALVDRSEPIVARIARPPLMPRSRPAR